MMELWIRSQDREALKKVSKIYMRYTGSTDPNIKAYTIYNSELETLGTYLSKERALKVLDEIHQRLIDLQTLMIDPSFSRMIKRNINCVFEMPKE